MTAPTRRKFLAWIAGVFGVAVAGGGTWWATTGDGDSTPAAGTAGASATPDPGAPAASMAPETSITPSPTTSTTTTTTTTTPPTSTSTTQPTTTTTTTSTTTTTTTQPPTTTQPTTTTTSTTSTTTQAPTTTTTSTTTAPPPTTVPPGNTGVPEMISREGWDARAPQGEFEAHTIERMTVHHTAAFLEDPSQAPARVRQHQRYHQDEKGWPDIAYHYIVDSAGRVFEGRPVWARGDTATSYDPTGHFLVCCEADFNRQSPTQAQIDALIYMLAWGAREFGVDPSTIKGHRDYAGTTCPGANLAPLIDDGSIEAMVRARL